MVDRTVPTGQVLRLIRPRKVRCGLDPPQVESLQMSMSGTAQSHHVGTAYRATRCRGTWSS